MENMKFKKIVYSQDFLRVQENSENLFHTPFKEYLRWLKVLIGEVIEESLGIVQTEVFHGDEGGSNSVRWKIFTELGLPFSIESWALLYERVDVSQNIKDQLFSNLDGALIITYESSPALLRLYDELKISYIDFSIHPIRFLEDYIFGIRTNIDGLKEQLKKHQVSEQLCKDRARIYRAKGAKVKVFEKIPEGSVVFMGQMGQDSSLIENNKMTSLDDVKEYLLESARLYPKVYYKKHPHNKNLSELMSFIGKQKNIEVGDWNIYDVLGSSAFSQVRSISSGTLYEAQYFNCSAVRLSSARSYFDTNIDDSLTFYGILRSPMSKEFWLKVFNNEIYNGSDYDSYSRGLEIALNARWGAK